MMACAIPISIILALMLVILFGAEKGGQYFDDAAEEAPDPASRNVCYTAGLIVSLAVVILLGGAVYLAGITKASPPLSLPELVVSFVLFVAIVWIVVRVKTRGMEKRRGREDQ